MSCWSIVLRKSEILVLPSLKFVSGFSLGNRHTKLDPQFKTLVGEHWNWVLVKEPQRDLCGWNCGLEIQWLLGFSQPVELEVVDKDGQLCDAAGSLDEGSPPHLVEDFSLNSSVSLAT